VAQADSSIRTILAPVSGLPSDAAALDEALATARMFGAHLQVLFVQIDPEQIAVQVGAGDPMGAAGLGTMIEGLVGEGEKRAAAARQGFEDACRRAGVPIGAAEGVGPSAEWLIVPGIDTECVPAFARAADLLLFVRPRDPEDAPVDLWEAALLSCGRPILLLPPAPHGVVPGTVAVAWKDSAEAARAITASLPLIKRAERLLVMTVDEGTDAQNAASGRIVAGLQRHNADTSLARLPAGTRDAAHVLLEEADQRGVGLLVMGGYGHSRARESVFGGFTRTMLRDAKLPVLMVH
jgi:nucleotide-binding universal stress UspA family protein